MLHAHEIELGANVGYLHKSSGTLARGPLVQRAGRFAVVNMEDPKVAAMVAYAVTHDEPLSGGAIPVVFIENPEIDRMHVSES